MKFKTTNKAIKNNYGYIVRVGYCDLQFLLRGCDAFAYTSGVYGWNADFYNVDGVCICTGYRSLIGERMPDGVVTKYNKKAQQIIDKYQWTDYKKQQKALERLRKKFADEVRATLQQSDAAKMRR